MKRILLGALCGFAWSAGLRGWMAQIAGAESTVTWLGTMAGVLAPGAVVGGLLGWADQLRVDGGRRGWRWLAVAPALFPAAVLAMPGALAAFLASGLGGGSVMVVIVGVAGGYAVAAHGPVWARFVGAAVALSIVPLWAVGAPFIEVGGALAVGTARGALLALQLYAQLALLCLACAIPFRCGNSPGTRKRSDAAGIPEAPDRFGVTCPDP